MALTYSIVTDEISPRLEDGIAFARAEDLQTVDVRSIGGVNFLSFGAVEQAEYAARIHAAGLQVGCLATPLLKWAAPGRDAGSSGDQFGFDAAGRSAGQLYEDAFAAARRLGTRHLRIFSYLTYDGFEIDHLKEAFDQLLALAEQRDCVLHVENEPVCNIASVGDLARLVTHWRHPRLKGLLDIGNSYRFGKPPGADELAAVMPHVDQIHFKDRSMSADRYVPMGEGDIPYAELLAPCLAGARDRHLSLTVETHVPDDQPAASRRSLRGLRRIVGELTAGS